MKQISLLVLITLLSWINGSAQFSGWQTAWTYPQYPAGRTVAVDMVRDRTDHLYVLAIVNDSSQQYLQSAALLKYTPTGTLVWRKDFTGYGIREMDVYNLEIDSLDRLYVAGNYGEYMTPNPPATDVTLLIDTVVSSDPTENGRYNAFLFSLDTSGKRIQSRFFTGNNRGLYVVGLSAARSGQVAMTGSYIDTFQMDTFRVTQPMVGQQQRYVVMRLDQEGKPKMGRGTRGVTSLAGCTLNERGDIYISGDFSGSIQFDTVLLTSQSTGAIIGTGFLVKLDSTGKAKWISGVYGHLPQSGPSVYGDVGLYSIIEQPNGNVLALGSYYFCSVSVNNRSFTLPFSSQGISIVACFNSTGSPIWLKGTTPDMGRSGLGGIISDSFNNIYCSGGSYDPASFGNDTVTWGGSSSGTDAFLYKLNASGNLIWARFAGGSYHDGGGATVLSADGSAVYMAGGSESPDSISFGSFKCPLAGFSTLFVAKTSTTALQVTDFIPKASFPVILFPNPATDVLTARISEHVLLREVLVADLTGQVRIQLSGTATHGSEIRIPVSLLPAGQYLLLLRAQNGQQAFQSFTRL